MCNLCHKAIKEVNCKVTLFFESNFLVNITSIHALVAASSTCDAAHRLSAAHIIPVLRKPFILHILPGIDLSSYF